MNIPSIECLLGELAQLKAEIRIKDLTIGSMCNDFKKLTAERDEWEANSGQWEQEYYKASAERDAALALQQEANLILIDQSRSNEVLKSALREAKEALVMNIVGTGGRTPAAHNAIATINKIFGE